MKQALLLYLLLFVASCKPANEKEAVEKSNTTSLANTFVDAFYSFDRDSLNSVLSFAETSKANLLYYQQWAACGHYEIVQRGRLIEKNDSLVLVPVTVKDDLMAALQLDFNVTDTFHLTIHEGRIHSVQTSSNDPAVYYEAKEWVKQNRPELIEKACEGIWNGGPTPCECIRGMLTGFAAFVVSQK